MSVVKVNPFRRIKPTPRNFELLGRQMTAGWRVLPDFFILGALKSGTSSLHSHLVQHPQLRAAFKSAVHYFDGRIRLGVDSYRLGSFFYRLYFPFSSSMAPGMRAYDATPAYFFYPLAPQRIQALVPKASMILMLRNPTERAISHYFHAVRLGREDLPIEEAMDAEERRSVEVFDGENVSAQGQRDLRFIVHSYKSCGLYYKQLKRYFNFFPREQFLILKSEDYFDDPALRLRQIFEFLDVDPTVLPADLEPANVAPNRTKVPVEVYEKLDAYFRPHNEALYELLGEDFGW